MFTGLVEEVGKVKSVRRTSGLMKISVEAEIARNTAPGDSVSVNGVCLTASGVGAGRFSFDAVGETCSASTLGSLRPGRAVNLERALRADSRLGGHFVYGHVDCTARITEKGGGGFSLRLPEEFSAYLVPKASIAVDGISLTLQSVRPPEAEIAVIPHTLANTNLSSLKPGDEVNIEVDFIAKQVITLMERYGYRGRRF